MNYRNYPGQKNGAIRAFTGRQHRSRGINLVCFIMVSLRSVMATTPSVVQRYVDGLSASVREFG
jgi:hypothetical protein